MHFLSWLRWYKKPEYRDIKEYSTAVSSGRRSLSPDGRKTSIPSQLALDRILQNKTCELPHLISPRASRSSTDMRHPPTQAVPCPSTTSTCT